MPCPPPVAQRCAGNAAENSTLIIAGTDCCRRREQKRRTELSNFFKTRRRSILLPCSFGPWDHAAQDAFRHRIGSIHASCFLQAARMKRWKEVRSGMVCRRMFVAELRLAFACRHFDRRALVWRRPVHCIGRTGRSGDRSGCRHPDGEESCAQFHLPNLSPGRR